MLQLNPFWNSSTGSASPIAGAKTAKLVSVPRNGGEENAITSAEDIGVYKPPRVFIFNHRFHIVATVPYSRVHSRNSYRAV